ncbi:hypothetical protein PMAYCL1PPCAC_20953, partial [Pristionchus mayeri]
AHVDNGTISEKYQVCKNELTTEKILYYISLLPMFILWLMLSFESNSQAVFMPKAILSGIILALTIAY